jgi:hypothetical protein
MFLGALPAPSIVYVHSGLFPHPSRLSAPGHLGYALLGIQCLLGVTRRTWISLSTTLHYYSLLPPPLLGP